MGLEYEPCSAAKRFDETRELCLSWGPCQFATLGFIVDRAWKIDSHVVEEFYRFLIPPASLHIQAG